MAMKGRDLRIEYSADDTNYTVVAGARSDSLTFNSESINITDKDDGGVQVLLDDVATKSMSLSCTGILKDDTFLTLAQAATSDTSLHFFRISVGSLVTLKAKFFIESFELSGEESGETTFTMSLVSGSAVTVV